MISPPIVRTGQEREGVAVLLQRLTGHVEIELANDGGWRDWLGRVAAAVALRAVPVELSSDELGAMVRRGHAVVLVPGGVLLLGRAQRGTR